MCSGHIYILYVYRHIHIHVLYLLNIYIYMHICVWYHLASAWYVCYTCRVVCLHVYACDNAVLYVRVTATRHFVYVHMISVSTCMYKKTYVYVDTFIMDIHGEQKCTTSTHMHICARTHIYIHTRSYIHTYIHTHTLRPFQSSKKVWIALQLLLGRITYPTPRYVCMYVCIYVCMYVCMHA
jgi:hypothetical protein